MSNPGIEPKAFPMATIGTLVGTVVVAVLIALLGSVAPHMILGTACMALGFGGRLVTLVADLPAATEKLIGGLCLAAIVLGAVCFDDFLTRVIVAAVGLVLLLILEAIEARTAKR